MRHNYLLSVPAALLLTLPALGQTVDSQQISGTVTDASGAVVPNATVTVTNTGTGLKKAATTNAEGNYIVLDIPIGDYDIATSVPGFKATELRGIRVDVGDKPSVPITLQLGQANETVTVEADTVLIHTTSAEVGTVVTSEQATKLQLNGRNYVQLIALQPGVSQTVSSAFSGLFGSYGVAGNGQSIDGNRPDNSNFFIDGVDNKDNGGSGNNFVNISPDAPEEFRTAASSYDASYGGSAGATISVAIKNGTRDFHGEAYEFLRNKGLQAYPYQPLGTVTPTKLPLVYNDFGWTLGGPIFIPGRFNVNRDKLFFFGGEEYKRLRTSSLTTTSVPTAAQKTGDFSAFASSAIPINPVTGQPYAGGIIPQCTGGQTTGCSTANGRALAALFPAANSGSNFIFPSLGNDNQQEYLAKIDYNLDEKNQISGH